MKGIHMLPSYYLFFYYPQNNDPPLANYKCYRITVSTKNPLYIFAHNSLAYITNYFHCDWLIVSNLRGSITSGSFSSS